MTLVFHWPAIAASTALGLVLYFLVLTPAGIPALVCRAIQKRRKNAPGQGAAQSGAFEARPSEPEGIEAKAPQDAVPGEAEPRENAPTPEAFSGAEAGQEVPEAEFCACEEHCGDGNCACEEHCGDGNCGCEEHCGNGSCGCDDAAGSCACSEGAGTGHWAIGAGLAAVASFAQSWCLAGFLNFTGSNTLGMGLLAGVQLSLGLAVPGCVLAAWSSGARPCKVAKCAVWLVLAQALAGGILAVWR